VPDLNRPFQELILGLMEAVYPEVCAGCDGLPADLAWSPAGFRVPGLRFFDAPHLCQSCVQRLAVSGPAHRTLEVNPGMELPVLGAAHISDHLTRVVGALKYRTLRGVAWPLAALLATHLAASPLLEGGSQPVLVPVPLHPRRERFRGFNQAALLARLVAGQLGLQVAEGLARRVKSTAQQAQISDPDQRRRNLDGAFRSLVSAPDSGVSLILVDDIITTGATCGALARTLLADGWSVGGMVGVGVLEMGAVDAG
jgi:ComF family protein